MSAIKKKLFKDINLEDIFFESLRASYPGFDNWFNSKLKLGESAYVLEHGGVQGFLYLKEENEEDCTITPILEAKKRLKVGTFKINAHGTKLGERFVKLIIDEMFRNNYEETYVTIFEEHKTLIKLMEKYGFKIWGSKTSVAGIENVYLKKKTDICNDMLLDYPRINIVEKNKFMLSIYPKFHTRMFPDSKLNTERGHVIEDESVTNSISKIYLSAAWGLDKCKNGDVLVIYRTADQGKSAPFSSVATSICVVNEVRSIYSFSNYDEFEKYCMKTSVFTKVELMEFWNSKAYKNVISMTYNIALSNRIIRKSLLDDVEIENGRWVLVPLSNKQFNKILELGGVSEDFIIN